MKKLFINFGMLAVMAFAMMTVAGSASAQNRHRTDNNNQTTNQRELRSRTDRNNRNFGRGRRKNTNGYRNYGQYRRTQVGNRRWSRSRHVMNRTRTTRRRRDRN